MSAPTCRHPDCSRVVPAGNVAYCSLGCRRSYETMTAMLALCEHGYRSYECWTCRQGTLLKRIDQHDMILRHAKLHLSVNILLELDPTQIENDIRRVFHGIPEELGEKLDILRCVHQIRNRL